MNHTEGLTRAFAETLVGFRNKAGVSQENLAYSIGLNRTYVYRVEKGATNPSLEAIFRFADGVNVPPEELVRETRIRLEQLQDRHKS